MLVSNARRHSLGILITACISMTCYADFAAPAASDTAVPPNQTVTSADAFPYIAYVGERGISVRSGPGTEYYTTAFLDWGSKVEVYRIDKEKWAAIRPTSRAFSWVPASNVEISEQPDLGIVTQPGTTTRVGTPHGNRHEVEYIQLAEGEVVEILGKKKLPERDGAPSQVWYKITPPAGEFRWVLADSLTRQPPSQEGLDEDSAQSALPQIVQTSHTASANEDHEDAERVSADERLVLAADTSAEGDQWTVVDREDDSWDQVETAEDLQVRIRQEQLQQAQLQQAQLQQAQLQQAQTQQAQTQQTPIQQTQFTEETTQDAAGASAPLSELPTPPPSSGGFREVGANPQAGTTTPETSPPPRPNALASSPTPTSSYVGGTVSRELLWQELLQIETGLTRTVLLDPSLWDLVELRARAQVIIDMSQDGALRSDASRLLAKIAQFEDLKRRHQQLASAGQGVDKQSIGGILGSTLAAAGMAGAARTAGDYTGVGWLMPVVTQRRGVPRYALTDPNGNILQFVSPAPGMNLHQYERQRIGIYGQRGYIAELNKPHLTAERVVSIGTLR